MDRCLVCNQLNVNITDVRGRDIFEQRLKRILGDKGQNVPTRGPMYSCIKCMAQMYTDEQNNPLTLSIPQLLRSSDSDQIATQPEPQVLATSSYQSPDSSLYEDPSGETSESFTPSIPASSESLLGPQASFPTAISISNRSDSSSANADIEFRPPHDPRQLAQYIQIMSRPGPKSLKRKRILELGLTTAALQEVPGNTPPDVVQVADNSQQILQKLVQRIKPPAQKRPRYKSRSRDTSSSFSSSASLHIDESIRAPPALPRMSPISSQQTLRSPSPDRTAAKPQRRRLPSSSLSSEEERISGTPVGIRSQTISIRPPGKTQAAKRFFQPPLPSTVRRIQPVVRDDGNAHSNSGAPRRILISNTPTPVSATTGRDPRITNVKIINGG